MVDRYKWTIDSETVVSKACGPHRKVHVDSAAVDKRITVLGIIIPVWTIAAMDYRLWIAR